jgi:hypothetical protein
VLLQSFDQQACLRQQMEPQLLLPVLEQVLLLSYHMLLEQGRLNSMQIRFSYFTPNLEI